MTEREYAVDMINSMTDEQVAALVDYIKAFSGGDRDKTIKEDNDKREMLTRLKGMIKSVPVGDEKELLSEYRDERYGI